MKTNLGVKEKPICGVCGKDFYSLKALHGHMRSHPDRSWRGITPPSSSSAAASSLPCWSVTARRGRKSTSTSASASASEDEVVVNSLMFLSKSENSDGNDDMNMGLGFSTETAQQQQMMNCEMGFRKRKISSTTRVKKMKEIGDDSVVISEYQTQLTPTKKLYRCNSCNKEFSSHQALGGHKSSHNKTLQIKKRKMLDFDLNELPPMEDHHPQPAFQ